MDLVLRKISCEDRLPVSVVEDTFEIMCDGKHRCAFQQDTSALITGQCKQKDVGFWLKAISSLTHTFNNVSQSF